MTSRLHSDINVPPLVDIVLVLLIVFITLVPALPRVLSASLPRPVGKAPSISLLRLTLTRDGSLEVAGQSGISLVDALAKSPERILLRVHPDLPLSAPARTLDDIQGLRPGTKVSIVAWPG